jgi:hypothetical protein
MRARPCQGPERHRTLRAAKVSGEMMRYRVKAYRFSDTERWRVEINTLNGLLFGDGGIHFFLDDLNLIEYLIDIEVIKKDDGPGVILTVRDCQDHAHRLF